MSSLVRRILRRQSKLNLKLRKAVTQGKLRLVATLLDEGASPVWSEDPHDDDDASPRFEMNALLLACHYGHAEILSVLLDWFFGSPELLMLWGRAMHCVAIRNGQWATFQRLVDRRISTDHSDRSIALPAPAFIAAECGQSKMLQLLLKRSASSLAGYSFNGHSLLSIASKNGHYDCVSTLLRYHTIADDASLDFALDIARQHRQAHILVLLTSCLPEYSSNATPIDYSTATASDGSSGSVKKKKKSKGQHHHNQRASLAETDILSDDEEKTEQDHGGRSSSAWLYARDSDLQVYHPYMDDDDDDGYEDDAQAKLYEEYIRSLEDNNDEEQDWTSTPPVTSAKAHSAAIRSLVEQPQKPTWYYRNEEILPYETEAKPLLPPPSNDPNSGPSWLFVSPSITQISRKLISVRSHSLRSLRASI